MKYTKDQKEKLINKVNFWWHSIDLGDGIVTNGYLSQDMLKTLSYGIPQNLNNKSVLDVGAWDGYYSFLSEKRGSDEVTAIDNGHLLDKTSGFLIAKKILDSKVRFIFMDLFDIPKKLDKKFDIVLFYGVLYHLKHPLLALEILSSITKEVLVIESHCIDFNSEIPLMRFYPGNELNNDSSNWWGPNKRCFIDMLKTVGFKRIEIIKELPKSYRILLRAYK